jgi:sugar phosphate isomerase/epimerase
MTFPIALQLYSLREAAAQDYAAVVRKVAEMGYQGVETAGFPGTTPEAAGKLFGELGLKVPSAHVFPPPTGDKLKEALDTLAAIGCRRIISGFGPKDFASVELTMHSIDILNQAHSEAAAHGIRFGVHNHWWEYVQVEGIYPYELMLKHLHPEIEFEVDTYWVRTAGVDPAQVVSRMGKRASLLHMKDGPAVKDQPMTAVGDGVVDVPAILAAGKGNAEWLIVEIDRCATDMAEACRKSYEYLKRIQEA